jgi:aspartate aminotransferase
MTGWRIGFAVGPEELVKRITTFQGHLTSNTSSISQWATVGALKESQAEVEKMRKIFERRRNLILKLLDQMPLISYIPPDGAFYVFINIKKCLGLSFRNNTILDDVVFCEVLLDEKNIALVPGSAFLQPGYCRISYSVSGSDIQEGMSRLAEFLSELKDLDT